MEFSIPPEMLYPLALGAAFPLSLLLVSRLHGLKSRNAIRFIVAFAITLTAWFAGSLLLSGRFRPDTWGDWLLSLAIVVSFLLFHLEIWALLSRGYTLGLLVVLLDAGAPTPESILARRYRGGEGLRWVMHHRVSGLEGAQLVRRLDNRLILTYPFGSLIAIVYSVLVGLLGLRKTG
jgi:hypothetical protein